MPNEIRTLNPELVLRDIPAKLVQRWRQTQQGLFGASGMGSHQHHAINRRKDSVQFSCQWVILRQQRWVTPRECRSVRAKLWTWTGSIRGNAFSYMVPLAHLWPGELSIVIKNKAFECRMARETFEAVLFHFRIGLIGGPAIVRHPINRCHHAGSVTTSFTMDIYGLPGRIIHQLQESDDCGI